jgi:hypothetical protein
MILIIRYSLRKERFLHEAWASNAFVISLPSDPAWKVDATPYANPASGILGVHSQRHTHPGCVKTGETNYDDPESGSWTEVECAVLGVQGNARRRGMIAIAQARRCLIAFPITSDILNRGTIPSASDSVRNRHTIYVFTLIKIRR